MSQVWYSAKGRVRINNMTDDHLKAVINTCSSKLSISGDIYYNGRRTSRWIELFKAEQNKRILKIEIKKLNYKIY